jgi:flavin reductase (DIM6/NTAB) family NADH-FMN oxidoreductase RutF
VELLIDELAVRERYKFLTAIVTPRPIAFVTTCDERGIHNAGPFSFFNVFSEDPALVILGISSRPDGRTKDTLRNIRAMRAFVIAMVDPSIAEAMHTCSADFPYGECELDHAGVTLVPSRTIPVMRIKEAPASLECELSEVVTLTERRHLVLGHVRCIHLQDDIIDPDTRRIIPDKYSPLGRLYGDHYAWLGDRYARAIPSYEDVTGNRPVFNEVQTPHEAASTPSLVLKVE